MAKSKKKAEKKPVKEDSFNEGESEWDSASTGISENTQEDEY